MKRLLALGLVCVALLVAVLYLWSAELPADLATPNEGWDKTTTLEERQNIEKRASELRRSLASSGRVSN
jgi:hypothetical protein